MTDKAPKHAMHKQLKERKEVKCLKCGWAWHTWKRRPPICPHCHSYYWDEEPEENANV